MPKPPTIEELILLKQDICALRRVVCESLDALSDRVERMLPEELPVKRPVRDWRKEVKSWPSWKKTAARPIGR